MLRYSFPLIISYSITDLLWEVLHAQYHKNAYFIVISIYLRILYSSIIIAARELTQEIYMKN